MDGGTPRTRARRWWVVGAGLLAVTMAGGALAWRRAVASDLARERDRHAPAYASAYVGSSTCSPCHAEHATSWHRSFHRTMTQDVGSGGGGAAASSAVAGDFNGATYRYPGPRRGCIGMRPVATS